MSNNHNLRISHSIEPLDMHEQRLAFSLADFLRKPLECFRAFIAHGEDIGPTGELQRSQRDPFPPRIVPGTTTFSDASEARIDIEHPFSYTERNRLVTQRFDSTAQGYATVLAGLKTYVEQAHS